MDTDIFLNKCKEIVKDYDLRDYDYYIGSKNEGYIVLNDILDEETAFDALIPNENPSGLFADNEEPLEDTIGSNVDSDELETMDISELF